MLNMENNPPSLLVAILKALAVYDIEEKDKEKIVELLTHNNSAVRIATLKTLKGKR
jgi:hypothetical protein